MTSPCFQQRLRLFRRLTFGAYILASSKAL